MLRIINIVLCRWEMKKKKKKAWKHSVITRTSFGFPFKMPPFPGIRYNSREKKTATWHITPNKVKNKKQKTLFWRIRILTELQNQMSPNPLGYKYEHGSPADILQYAYAFRNNFKIYEQMPSYGETSSFYATASWPACEQPKFIEREQTWANCRKTIAT